MYQLINMAHQPDIFFETDDSYWHGEIAYAKRKLADNKINHLRKEVFTVCPTDDLYEQMAINTYVISKLIKFKKGKLYFMGQKFNIASVVSHYDKVMQISIEISKGTSIIKLHTEQLAKELGGWFIINNIGIPTFVLMREWNTYKFKD